MLPTVGWEGEKWEAGRERSEERKEFWGRRKNSSTLFLFVSIKFRFAAAIHRLLALQSMYTDPHARG